MRVKREEERAHPVTLIVIVFSDGLAGVEGEWSHHISYKLTRTFVKANQGTFGILRAFIERQEIFHPPEERRSELAQTPLALEVGLQFVFFSTSRTVIGSMRSSTSTSTSLSAKRRNVQRERPSGGVEHANAVI